MTVSNNKSQVSTVALVLVLAFAAAFMICVPAVIATAIEPLTVFLWAMLDSMVIAQLLVSTRVLVRELFSRFLVRVNSAFLF